jgi:hypothetical protein
MSALTLLTETAEVEESRSLRLKTDMLLVEVWARNRFVSIRSIHTERKESRLQK